MSFTLECFFLPNHPSSFKQFLQGCCPLLRRAQRQYFPSFNYPSEEPHVRERAGCVKKASTETILCGLPLDSDKCVRKITSNVCLQDTAESTT